MMPSGMYPCSRSAFLAVDQGQMDIFGGLPAECLVQQQVFRIGRQVFRSPDNVGDVHEVVVHYVGEVVGGHAVALEQHLIVKGRVLDCYLSVHHVVPGLRHRRFYTCRQLLYYPAVPEAHACGYGHGVISGVHVSGEGDVRMRVNPYHRHVVPVPVRQICEGNHACRALPAQCDDAVRGRHFQYVQSSSRLGRDDVTVHYPVRHCPLTRVQAYGYCVGLLIIACRN